jgi:hypothetical protein
MGEPALQGLRIVSHAPCFADWFSSAAKSVTSALDKFDETLASAQDSAAATASTVADKAKEAVSTAADGVSSGTPFLALRVTCRLSPDREGGEQRRWVGRGGRHEI